MARKKTKEMPPWMLEYAADVCTLLGIEHYDVQLFYVDGFAGEPDQSGEADVNTRYYWARINLRESYVEKATEEEIKHLIFHELFHVALGPAANSVDRIIELVPTRLQEHAIELWSDGVEPVIEQTVKALMRTIKPTSARAALPEPDRIDIPQE